MNSLEEISQKIVDEIKAINRLNNVVVAYSGGMDSTLALYLTKKALGKKMVDAVTIDWGMYAYKKSRENIKKLIEILDVSHTFIHGEKEIESLHARGPGCNRCVKKIKIPILKKYAKGRIIIGGANQSDSWGKQHIKILDNIYSPLLELTKEDIRELLNYYNIPIIRIGEHSIREGCILKHLWKPLVSPYYHGLSVVKANEFLIKYLKDIGYEAKIANVKIIGPLSKNIALVNVYPLPSNHVRKDIIVQLNSIKELDEVYFVKGPIKLIIRANMGQIRNKESLYWIERGRIGVDFGFPVFYEWIPSSNRKLNSFHVVSYEGGNML